MDTSVAKSRLVEKSASLAAVAVAVTIAVILLRRGLKGRRRKQNDARSQVLRKLLARHSTHTVGDRSALESVQRAVYGSPDEQQEVQPEPHTEAATRHLLLRAASRLTELARAGSQQLRKRKRPFPGEDQKVITKRQSLPSLEPKASTRLTLFESWPASTPAIGDARMLNPRSDRQKPGSGPRRQPK